MQITRRAVLLGASSLALTPTALFAASPFPWRARHGMLAQEYQATFG